MTQTIPSLRVDQGTLRPVDFPGIARQTKVRLMEDFSWDGNPVPADGENAGIAFKDLDPQKLFDEDTMSPPTKAGAQRVRQQIDAIDQSMNDIRRKAEQEGC